MLYRNNGNGTFTDVSKEAGIATIAATASASSSATMTMTGWPDVFVANDTTPNFLFHNEGRGTFKEVALPVRASQSPATGGRAPAWARTSATTTATATSISFVTNHELEAHTLFRNLGKGLFEDATFTSGVGPATLPFVGFGAGFVDYDNDADLDLGDRQRSCHEQPGHFRPGANEAQRNLLLRNDGGGDSGTSAACRARASRSRRSAARSPPATSTTTATSICASPTTPRRRPAAQQRAAGAIRCSCGWWGRAAIATRSARGLRVTAGARRRCAR